jgi:hypothetical protein
MNQILGMIRIGRAEIPIDQSLSLSWSRSEAAARRASYQRALWVALALDVAIAAYALLAPSSFSALLGLPPPGPAGWVSAWGGLLLFVATLHIPGLLDPVRRRWSNVFGIIGRFFLALIYLIAGGGFLWLAILQAALATVLAIFYFRLFRAELMSRP